MQGYMWKHGFGKEAGEECMVQSLHHVFQGKEDAGQDKHQYSLTIR